jgi:serine/threonine protein phosphatase PrpC
LTFSGVSVKGIAPYNPDKQNQDSLVLHQLPTGEVVLSVFDGHGEEGKTVSNHFQKRIPKCLANCKLFAQPETTGQAIKDALERSEKEIVDDVHVDTTLSGTTGVVGVIRGQRLYVANIGDSRAVFGVQDPNGTSKAYLARDITVDHKPDLPDEKKRIQEVGGRVFAVKFDDGIDGPARVWLSYADLPGLAMSRSLCDTIAKEAGVVSKPDLFETDITAEHKFLIMASDGLWEFMSSQEVVDIVAKYANTTNPDPEAAIEELIEESARRWRMNEPVIDDTSIIVAFFM